MKDVVVLLPGITGSVLEKDGRKVWAVSAGAITRALTGLGTNVRDLEMQGEDDPSLDDLGDGVKATELIPDIHLIPGLWRIDGYGEVSQTLKANFDLKDGENYFEFPYDWRRDNRVHGRRLRRESHNWLKAWREKSGNADARLILIAHSMGGLVARAFLELNEGWKDTSSLITFGTPYRGSLNALDFIGNGFKKGIWPLTIDLSDMLRSLTAIYQLLPVYPCFDPGDGQFVRPGETSAVPNMNSTRAAEALAFHRQLKEAVASNEQDANYVSNGYDIYPIVGFAQPTSQSALRDGARLIMQRDFQGEDIGGDGTVPRPSAIPEEMEDDRRRAMFSASSHGSLQNAEEVLRHVQGLLTTDYDLSIFRAAAANLSLDVDDVFSSQEELLVKALCSDPEIVPFVEITDTETGDIKASGELFDSVDDDWVQGMFPALPAGSYRITVSAPGAEAQPVSDLFVVFD